MTPCDAQRSINSDSNEYGRLWNQIMDDPSAQASLQTTCPADAVINIMI